MTEILVMRILASAFFVSSVVFLILWRLEMDVREHVAFMNELRLSNISNLITQGEDIEINGIVYVAKPTKRVMIDGVQYVEDSRFEITDDRIGIAYKRCAE